MMKNKLHSGFTLIEMAVALTLLGLIVGAVFSFVTVQQNETARQVTMSRQKKVAMALSNYAQNFGYLPCPAAPNAAVAGSARASCTAGTTDFTGIVPYRDLNLTVTDIIDGYGNPFSYTVAPNARYPVSSKVHANCRTSGVWNIGGVNINIYKATFCCYANDDGAKRIVLYFNTSNAVIPTQADNAILPSAGVNTVGAADSSELAYIAYVLVSHGKNGEGAFVLGTASRNVASGSIVSTYEAENADDDQFLYIIPQNLTIGSSSYFDDIVLWRTQQTTISESSNATCQAP